MDAPNHHIPETIRTLLSSRHLQKKLLSYFSVCLALCLLIIFVAFSLGIPWNNPSGNFSERGAYVLPTFCVLPALAIVGVLALVTRRWTNVALFWMDAAFSTAFLLTLSVLNSILFPTQGFLYPFLAFLMLHAFMMPYFHRYQAVLGVWSVLFFAGSELLSFRFLSETQRIFMRENGAASFWKLLAAETLFLAAIAYILTKIAKLLARSPEAKYRSQLENYVIKKFLGTGGMGKVYLATHTAICRPTALKIMEPKAEDFSTALSRFEREVRLCSTLTNPNTVTIFDFGKSGDSTFYYAMESLDGLDLQKWVEKFGPLPPNRLIHVLKQVCNSLAEAHQKGIIHRDIKPSNIFLARLGGLYDFVKVLDFGLAKELNSEQDALTQSHVFLGTPAYVAPEMVLDRNHVDARTDIYMLGCVAFWALTGRPPFTGENDAQVLLEHVQSLPQWPSEMAADEIPLELERIVMRCMEKRMEDRYEKIEELALALDAVPLEKPWTQAEARLWWETHLPEEAAETGGLLEQPTPLVPQAKLVEAIASSPSSASGELHLMSPSGERKIQPETRANTH